MQSLVKTAASMLNPEIDVLEEFTGYRFKPVDYIRERLGRSPWQSPIPDADDQIKIIDGYTHALKQMHERRDFQNGRLTEEELTVWQPGQVVKNYISIDAGHTVGKTALLAMLASHFFDTCAPSIVYTYAPTKEQINDLLWKEIREQRNGRGLPGLVQKVPRLSFRPNHFMVGRATNNAKGAGTERAQGQHERYMMFIVDEAEGVPDFIWSAIRSMASGGIAIVLIARNPRTKVSEAHKIRSRPFTQKFRIDCAYHPNVVFDRPIYESMVSRRYVDEMIDEFCSEVDEHDEEKLTFSVDWREGKIYEPEIEYLWRVMGHPGGAQSDNTICSYATYQKSQTAVPPANAPEHIAWLGIDAARFGSDYGTLYCRHNGTIRRVRRFAQQDGYEYYLAVKKLCDELDNEGVTEVYVRCDAGGGYASTVIDNLNRDLKLQRMFDVFKVEEINFSRKQPHDETQFADFITELYWYAGNILKSYHLQKPPNELEVDLTERTFKYARVLLEISPGVKEFKDVKQLTYNKEQFRKIYGRSPDDGDGFALCAMPPFLVYPPVMQVSRTHRVKTAVHR